MQKGLLNEAQLTVTNNSDCCDGYPHTPVVGAIALSEEFDPHARAPAEALGLRPSWNSLEVQLLN